MPKLSLVKQKVLRELEHLSKAQLEELAQFVARLKKNGGEAMDPLLRIAGTLAATPLSAREIEVELYGRDKK